MSMSRKDFELLARIIKEAKIVRQNSDPLNTTVDYVAKCIALGLNGHSATFDMARFLKACGVPE